MRKTALTLLGAVAVMAAAAPQKTAWRDPDLQGIWAQKYQIPLQRPARDAGRPTLTGEEVRQREAERARQAAAAPKRGDRIVARGTLEDHLRRRAQAVRRIGRNRRTQVGRVPPSAGARRRRTRRYRSCPEPPRIFRYSCDAAATAAVSVSDVNESLNSA